MATNLASFKSSEIELELWTLTRTQWIIEQMASRFHLDSSHFDLSFTPSAQNTINKETSFWPNYTKVFPQSSKAMKTASLWYLYQQITPAHEINKTPSEVTKQGYQVEREQATTDTEGREQPYNPLREARNLPMGSEDPPRTPSPGTLVVAVVVTQLFSYMVDIGVQYGYICTGKAFVFLHIPKDPTVVKYFLTHPKSGRRWAGLHRTAIGQVSKCEIRGKKSLDEMACGSQSMTNWREMNRPGMPHDVHSTNTKVLKAVSFQVLKRQRKGGFQGPMTFLQPFYQYRGQSAWSSNLKLSCFLHVSSFLIEW